MTLHRVIVADWVVGGYYSAHVNASASRGVVARTRASWPTSVLGPFSVVLPQLARWLGKVKGFGRRPLRARAGRAARLKARCASVRDILAPFRLGDFLADSSLFGVTLMKRAMMSNWVRRRQADIDDDRG